jgi:hypothetical protein
MPLASASTAFRRELLDRLASGVGASLSLLICCKKRTSARSIRSLTAA